MVRRLVVIISALALVGASACALAGCGETTSTTAVGATTTTLPTVEYLDPQPVDLTAIVNLDAADLTDAEKQVLASQSFVAVSPPADEASWKFWMIYENARYQGLPVLITTDSMLNAYHGLFDALLQRAEEATLFDQLTTMTQELYAAAYDQWTTATDDMVKADARLNMAYFATAASLLDPEAEIPEEVSAEVEAELALIGEAEGPAESPTLGYVEDYSQYQPRGHYTRSEKLEQYFRAMMWYGHTGFHINDRDPDITEQEAESLTRRAILVSASLTNNTERAWRAVYEPTSYLVGQSDDLSVEDMRRIVDGVFNTAQPNPDDLASTTKIASVQNGLNALPAPKILTAAVPDMGDSTDDAVTREEIERSFRVMGQRYIPDSYAFQQLLWPYVGSTDNKRTIPMGLDVMTVLGSDEAFRLAVELYGQQQYENWSSQTRKVRSEFVQTGSELWPESLYTGWLESLQRLMEIPEEGAPALMRTQPWALKSLNASLGSWAELRHDTILYAKQSVVAEGEGGEEPVSPGYVEPYPDFYEGISELADSLKRGLSTYDLLDAESMDKLDRMSTLAQSLSAISNKELRGMALTQQEIDLISTYGQVLESLEQFGTDEDGMTLSPSPEKCPVVADVHTDLVNDPQEVLEEATGYPLSLYAVLQLDGSLQVLVGASYSYYEFTAPITHRLTDEEWIDRLDTMSAPPLPDWTDAWIVKR